MESQLTIYIDEGGDAGVKDGLHYHGTRYEWLTLGAYVVRTANSASTVAIRDEIIANARIRQVSSLHYYKLKSDRRQQVCDILGGKPARAFCFASHKSNMREYVNRKLGKIKAEEFYRWCCRLLLERVQEFAEADAIAKGYPLAPLDIVFSENQGLDYEAMFSYFDTINEQAKIGQFEKKPKCWLPRLMERSHWKFEPQGKMAGLQLADVIASSFLQGANSGAANHDPGPAKALSRIITRDIYGRHKNAGVTLWPLKKQAPIPTKARPLFEFYGYRF